MFVGWLVGWLVVFFARLLRIQFSLLLVLPSSFSVYLPFTPNITIDITIILTAAAAAAAAVVVVVAAAAAAAVAAAATATS